MLLGKPPEQSYSWQATHSMCHVFNQFFPRAMKSCTLKLSSEPEFGNELQTNHKIGSMSSLTGTNTHIIPRFVQRILK